MDQQRFLGLFVMIFTIAATLLLLALFEHEAASKVEVGCMDPTERENVRSMTLQGINDGFTDQIKLLFEIWMKDPNEQPRRAMVGTNNAVNAHVRARKQALEWNPPAC